MANRIKTISLFSLTVALCFSVPSLGFAQDTNAPVKETKSKPAKKAAKSEPKPTTFSAKLASVDKVARTLTLDNRAKQVIQVTSETLITRDGKPAIFNDGNVGDAMNGTYKKADDGKLVALTVNFGEKPKPKKAEPKPKKPAATNAPVVEPPATAPPVTPAPAPSTPASTNAPAAQ